MASSATITDSSAVERVFPVSEHDLSTNEGIYAYLNQYTPFFASSVIRLSGGFANWTYRAALKEPYKYIDSIGQHTVLKTIVIKFSSNATSLDASVPLDLYRTRAEVAALRLVSGLDLPHFCGIATSQTDRTQPTIFLPELVFYDTTNHVGCYVDLGNLPTLMQYLTDHPGQEAVEIATRTGRLLGEFLAGLHIWGWKVLQTESSILDLFKRSVGAKEHCAWRTIGLVEGVAKEYQIEADWEKITNTLKREVLDVEQTFNMGDFWTGNVLIEMQGPTSQVIKALYILDWELAKTGRASTDIAQFAAEAYMLRQYNTLASSSTIATSVQMKVPPVTREISSAGEALLVSFLNAYEEYIKERSSEMEKSAEGNSTQPDTMLDSRSVIGHLCAHVATIGKTFSWTDKETTDKTVRTMLQLLITNDQESTKKSLKEVLTSLKDE
ncbi:Carboxy-terminal domain (CTD) phosphatase [Serendipita sp. 399]|nr:Carboxy-terminal domain (CTD) phosphatase [Serendipita sp. 399]